MGLPNYAIFSSGDMIVDPITKETGLLVMRIDVMAAYNAVTNRPVWAWDIWWTGSSIAAPLGARRSAYTEEGLYNMVHMGVFEHIKK